MPIYAKVSKEIELNGRTIEVEAEFYTYRDEIEEDSDVTACRNHPVTPEEVAQLKAMSPLEVFGEEAVWAKRQEIIDNGPQE